MEKAVISHMSIRKKIIFLTVIVSLLIFIGSSLLSFYQLRGAIFHEKEVQIQYITEIALNLLKEYKQRVDSGELTAEDAKERARARIAALNFDGNNYIWINDYDHKFIYHPIMERGHDATDLKDKNGVGPIVEAVRIAKGKGQGSFRYDWPKPGQDKTLTFPKISYVRAFPEWGWVLGAGVYVDDVAKIAMTAFLNSLILNLVLVAIVVIVVIFTVVRGITNSMNKIVKDLETTANQVTSASGQLSDSSQQLAEGSTEQAASIQETSSTLEESASMVRQNTENTKQAAMLAKQAKDSANKGNKDMQNMMNSMQELKKSSDQIAKIIKVIDEIAFQTNILALNAAVEAARAGEAGQGFAVVAEEVRNLAQRSAQAAKDTAGIIESNIHLSEQGVNVSKQVNESLLEINTQSQKVSDLLDEISAASQEQAQGIAQINKAISQMEQVVQSNASTAEESASASEELTAQAETMKEIVNSLIVMVNGTNAIHEQAHTAITTRTQVRKPINYKKNTKVVKPEDVIPLEDDMAGF
ncbi:MAG: hypothetical protein A2Y25_03135 [Candidatus Melainabacteria bacterium GWF2_37_15]|nr:MAG: hypothetical protein A2Y25_03135 [Candidatus Melainabacteria bacterium GWF2_37_15]